MKGFDIMITLDKNTEGKVNANVNVNGLFSILLTIAFIVLKLCGIIDWAWIWVLCPLWIGIAFLMIVFIIASVVMVIINR